MARADVCNNNKLPPEVLLKIFGHCNDLDDLVNIVDVCQMWRDVVIHQYAPVNDIVLRRRYDILDLINLLCKPVSFSKLRLVWDVPLHVDCGPLPLDALAKYATSLTRLRSFTFEVRSDLCEIGGWYRYMPETYYADYRLSDALMMALLQRTSARTLTHLTLQNVAGDKTTGMQLSEFINACQHLSHLVLNRCHLHPEAQDIILGIIPKLTHLQLLELRPTPTRPFDLSFIAAIKRGCPNIANNIEISGLRVKSSDDVSMLQFVCHTDKLSIVGLNTDQLASLMSCLSEHASRLGVHTLNVDECKDHITDHILLSLVQPLWPGLRNVNASGCHQLTNEGVVNVIMASPQLDTLRISAIKNINNDIIQLLDPVTLRREICGQVCVYAEHTNIDGRMMGGAAGFRHLMFHTGEDFDGSWRSVQLGSNRDIYLQF